MGGQRRAPPSSSVMPASVGTMPASADPAPDAPPPPPVPKPDPEPDVPAAPELASVPPVPPARPPPLVPASDTLPLGTPGVPTSAAGPELPVAPGGSRPGPVQPAAVHSNASASSRHGPFVPCVVPHPRLRTRLHIHIRIENGSGPRLRQPARGKTTPALPRLTAPPVAPILRPLRRCSSVGQSGRFIRARSVVRIHSSAPGGSQGCGRARAAALTAMLP